MSSVMIRSVPNFRAGIGVRRGRSRVTTGYPGRVSTCMKEFDPFRLDTDNECLWRRSDHGNEERILIKPKAFGILRYLVDHAGRLATQEELLDAIWPNTYVQPEVLKRHIVDIRNLLGDDPKSPTFIETRPWRGYQFIAAVRNAVLAVPSAADIPAQATPIYKDQALDDSLACPETASGGQQRQDVFVTGECGIGDPTFVSAVERLIEVGTISHDLIPDEHDLVNRDIRMPLDGRRECDMKNVDLRKEIGKLIQQRKDIDRAIADLERLEASLVGKVRPSELDISEKSETLFEVKQNSRLGRP